MSEVVEKGAGKAGEGVKKVVEKIASNEDLLAIVVILLSLTLAGVVIYVGYRSYKAWKERGGKGGAG